MLLWLCAVDKDSTLWGLCKRGMKGEVIPGQKVKLRTSILLARALYNRSDGGGRVSVHIV